MKRTAPLTAVGVVLFLGSRNAANAHEHSRVIAAVDCQNGVAKRNENLDFA